MVQTMLSPWRLTTIACVVLALIDGTTAESECCSTCIGKVATSPYDYDPLIYDQCKLKPSGPRVCCFDCGSLGDPNYDDAISYSSDGTTPTIKAGTWVKMQWSSVKKVTYIALKDGQKKIVTPGLNDTAATETSGYFMICAKSKGSLVFRGWGSDTCRQASPEKTIKITEGEAGATCDAKAPDAPVSTTQTSTTSDGQCNLNRASLKIVDGKEQCVCVSDWAGPPSCDQMPAWKWAITIGGGIAALFSIVISVRAFMKSREKKRQAEDDNDIPVLKNDVETLHIGGADHRRGVSPPSQQTMYRRDIDDEYSVQKVSNREFSL